MSGYVHAPLGSRVQEGVEAVCTSACKDSTFHTERRNDQREEREVESCLCLLTEGKGGGGLEITGGAVSVKTTPE